jgi:hypothetical protein
METLQLLFFPSGHKPEPGVSHERLAYVALKLSGLDESRYKTVLDGEEYIIISPYRCMSFIEFDGVITDMINKLKDIRRQAKVKFDKDDEKRRLKSSK